MSHSLKKTNALISFFLKYQFKLTFWLSVFEIQGDSCWDTGAFMQKRLHQFYHLDTQRMNHSAQSACLIKPTEWRSCTSSSEQIQSGPLLCLHYSTNGRAAAVNVDEHSWHAYDHPPQHRGPVFTVSSHHSAQLVTGQRCSGCQRSLSRCHAGRRNAAEAYWEVNVSNVRDLRLKGSICVPVSVSPL